MKLNKGTAPGKDQVPMLKLRGLSLGADLLESTSAEKDLGILVEPPVDHEPVVLWGTSGRLCPAG